MRKTYLKMLKAQLLCQHKFEFDLKMDKLKADEYLLQMDLEAETEQLENLLEKIER